MTDKQLFKQLKEESKVLCRRIYELGEKIKDDEQSRCSHEFEYAGHNHKGDAYECIHCGKTEWR